MNQLFEFLLRQRNLLLFVLLQLISLWSVFTYNNYQHTLYFNTTNAWAASILSTRQEVASYHQLREINGELALENQKAASASISIASAGSTESGFAGIFSKASLDRYKPIACKVIDQSTRNSQNYLTIEKGYLDGIKPGMAVISSTGVVGKVISCQANLSLIVSVLHTSNTVSAKIKSSGELGYIKWPGYQPEVAELMDVSKYKKVVKGDTIVTSDYNAVYPPNVPIGIVAKVGLQDDGTFHDIKVMLLTHFSTLRYVYVIENKFAGQQAKLEQAKPKID